MSTVTKFDPARFEANLNRLESMGCGEAAANFREMRDVIVERITGPDDPMKAASALYRSDTRKLTHDQREAVIQHIDWMRTRLTCEEWAGKLGWDIPAYGTAEWMEMQSAFLNQ